MPGFELTGVIAACCSPDHAVSCVSTLANPCLTLLPNPSSLTPSSLHRCISNYVFNPLTAKLFNPNFHPLEVVSR